MKRLMQALWICIVAFAITGPMGALFFIIENAIDDRSPRRDALPPDSGSIVFVQQDAGLAPTTWWYSQDGSISATPLDGGVPFEALWLDGHSPTSKNFAIANQGSSVIIQPQHLNPWGNPCVTYDGGAAAFVISYAGEPIATFRNVYYCDSGPPCLVVDDAGTCVELHEARACLLLLRGSGAP